MRLKDMQIRLNAMEARAIETRAVQRRIETFMQGETPPLNGRFRIMSPTALVGYFYADSGRVETETWGAA